MQQKLIVHHSTFYPELKYQLVTRVSEIRDGHYNVRTADNRLVTFDLFFDDTELYEEYELKVNANCRDELVYVYVPATLKNTGYLAGLEGIWAEDNTLYAYVCNDKGQWVNVPFSAITVIATRQAVA